MVIVLSEAMNVSVRGLFCLSNAWTYYLATDARKHCRHVSAIVGEYSSVSKMPGALIGQSPSPRPAEPEAMCLVVVLFCQHR